MDSAALIHLQRTAEQGERIRAAHRCLGRAAAQRRPARHAAAPSPRRWRFLLANTVTPRPLPGLPSPPPNSLHPPVPAFSHSDSLHFD